MSLTRSMVDQCVALLHAAGLRALRLRERGAAETRAEWRFKPDGSIVTPADTGIQYWLAQRLFTILVGWQLLAEEAPRPQLDSSKPIAILDPIDGSLNFVRGCAWFAISLALIDGERRIGIVHAPALGRTWRSDDLPPVRCSKPLRYLHTSSDWHRVIRSNYAGGIRVTGATALDLAMLADTELSHEGAILSRYKIWDAAAGLLIAERAGARVLDLRTRHTLSAGRLIDAALRWKLPKPVLVARESDLNRLDENLTLMHAGNARRSGSR